MIYIWWGVKIEVEHNFRQWRGVFRILVDWGNCIKTGTLRIDNVLHYDGIFLYAEILTVGIPVGRNKGTISGGENAWQIIFLYLYWAQAVYQDVAIVMRSREITGVRDMMPIPGRWDIWYSVLWYLLMCRMLYPRIKTISNTINTFLP